MKKDWMIKSEKTVKGLYVTKQTLLGMSRRPEDFPLPYGNRFHMMADDGVEYQIVNFNAENLTRAVELGLEMPVTLLVLEDHFAAIHDSRIPNKWYDQIWHAPLHLLPAYQKLELQREIESRDKEVIETDLGVAVLYHGDKIPRRFPKEPEPKPMKIDWKCTEETGVVIVNPEGLSKLQLEKEN